MVIWLIGMSASGKTTIGKKLHDKLTLSNEKWIFLDGDTFRNILGEDLGHTIEDRRKNAYRISRFCEFLSSQGINVLACVLSIFHDNQKYNKENIENYKEVYIDVDFEELIRRDNKDLYNQALEGKIDNVVGVDIKFKPPYSPDLIINNNAQNTDFESIIQKIISECKIELNDSYLYTNNNLLEQPHKYQYSKFEGKNFFKNFLNDRKNTYSFIEKKFLKLNDICNMNMKLKAKDHIIADELILKEYLLYLLEESEDILKENNYTLSLLIKRFEVSKKLYARYDSMEIRKSCLEYENLLNYPLFSLVLQKFYNLSSSNEDKLIYLNAILKVNDIISSIKTEIIIPIEMKLSLKAIDGELEITKDYIC